MYNLIKELFSLLTPQQRHKFYTLQVLVVLMAFTEVLAVASIGPFMALVGDISLIEHNGLLQQAYQISGLIDPMGFLYFLGFAVLFTLGFSSLLSIYTIWKLSLFAAKTGTEIADRLYSHYMEQEWLFHASGSSAQLTKQISIEAIRVTDSIIQPMMQMNARIVLILFISISIFLYDPLVSLTGLALFLFAYVLLFKIVKARLSRNGSAMSDLMMQRFKLMNEGFGGIKDILLLNRKDSLISRFKGTGRGFAKARGENVALTQVPRYFMELLAYGVLVVLILVLIKKSDGDLGQVLSMLAIYALATMKLLPALQIVYSSLAQVKGSSAAFESIKKDLMDSKANKITNASQSQTPLSVKQSIALKNITFTYPGKENPALLNLNLKIPVKKVIGIVGPSGSGKSTVIDLLLGLITPQQGELLIDEVEITGCNKRAWQHRIGFVPQNIFLSDGSIAENVTFGLSKKDIDIVQVQTAIKLAHLDEWIKQLPDGLQTKVGERGVQLSGGQRQRIGIARALYHEADILVFDEATSALDGITEKMIMDSIHDFSGQKTIIMIAHRLKTVQKCDTIFYIDQGEVVDQGSYEYLVQNNAQFKKMANHA